MAESQIGAQMFTLRDFCKGPGDIAKSCRRLRDIGYRAVQVSALGPIEPAELAKILNGEGLACASTHVSLEEMKETQQCLAYHEVLSCQHTAIGGFSSGDAKDWIRFTSDFNEVARTLSDAGLHVGYHNHNHEWALLDDKRPIDILLEHCGPQIYFEMDTYWVAAAGADPAAWITAAAQGERRIPCVHLKDMQISLERQPKMCEIGSGNLNWPAILKACREADVQWYLVERDSGELDPFESLKISLENLRSMGLE